MEQTLGKRIIENRKRLGLTQDRLAEQLGVTAQAVSKWENNQSCPDITTLPRLAEIFGITTDELLGIEPPRKVHQAELITEKDEPNGLNIENGTWEFKYDGGRKSGVGLALWVLLVGGLLLISNLLHWAAGLWEIAWPSALLLYGLWGLWPRFSLFRLSCSLFGGYNLLSNLGLLPYHLGKELLVPVLLLMFGLSLLANALKKDPKSSYQLSHNGQVIHDSSRKFMTSCSVEGETFECSTLFGSSRPKFEMERMSQGTIEVAFGELTVDLSGCQEIGEDCTIDANCSFGQLIILVPRKWRVEPLSSTAFASAEMIGDPAPDAKYLIRIQSEVSFGEVKIQYI